MFAAIGALAAVGLVVLGILQLSRSGGGGSPSSVAPVAPPATPTTGSSSGSSPSPVAQGGTSNGTRLGPDLQPLSSEPCRTTTFANGSAWQLGGVRASGRSYDSAYSCNLFSAGVGRLDFVVGRSYRQFTVTMGFADDSSSTRHQVKFEIIGDDINYLDTPSILKFGEIRDVAVDVSGVSRLTLKITEQGAPGGTDAPSRPIWASPTLKK